MMLFIRKVTAREHEHTMPVVLVFFSMISKTHMPIHNAPPFARYVMNFIIGSSHPARRLSYIHNSMSPSSLSKVSIIYPPAIYVNLSLEYIYTKTDKPVKKRACPLCINAPVHIFANLYYDKFIFMYKKLKIMCDTLNKLNLHRKLISNYSLTGSIFQMFSA